MKSECSTKWELQQYIELPDAIAKWCLIATFIDGRMAHDNLATAKRRLPNYKWKLREIHTEIYHVADYE